MGKKYANKKSLNGNYFIIVSIGKEIRVEFGRECKRNDLDCCSLVREYKKDVIAKSPQGTVRYSLLNKNRVKVTSRHGTCIFDEDNCITKAFKPSFEHGR